MRRWRDPPRDVALMAAPQPAGAPPRRTAWLALGDSYTIGEGVAADDAWPRQLARALRADGVAIDDPRIIATTGWTTDELAAAIDAAEAAGDAPGRDHALVSLLVGVNNQYRGRAVGEYDREFAELLGRAVGFAGGDPGRVLVLSIPDWAATGFGAEGGGDRERTAREIDACNAVAQARCAALGVAFIDVTPISRARGAEPAMLADDGLHPSAAMYALWTAIALPVARRLMAPTRATA